MAKKIEATKLVVIDTKGSITELGGISGPVINPCVLPVSTLKTLVSNRRKVYEVNPRNRSERVLLTISNITKDNFSPATQAPKANVAPADTKSTKPAKNGKDSAAEKTETKTETKSDFVSNS